MLKKRFPGGLKKAVTFSFDDGVIEDIRLAELFNKYGLKGTFNISSKLFEKIVDFVMWGKYDVHQVRLSIEKAIEVYRGHEVASHGSTHENVNFLDDEGKYQEINNDVKTLEEIFGYPVRGFAYPCGCYDKESVEYIKNKTDIVYARTVHNTYNFSLPIVDHAWQCSCFHLDEKLPQLVDRFVKEAPEKGEDSWLFSIWGHSYELEVVNNWQAMENACEKLGKLKDTWFATNIQVFDYLNAFDNLTIGNKCAYNRSAFELFFEIDGTDYSIKPGETIKLK